MNILFTICGRAGSKGIKNKNIKHFLGFPLPYYSVSVIDLYTEKNPNHSVDIALNTDSQELITLIKHLKMNVEIIEREESLGQDNSPKVPVILNSLKVMKKRKLKDYDMVVDLDLTAPLRSLDDLENIISKKVDTNVDVVFSVTNSRRNPYFNMVKKSNGSFERVIDSSFNTRQEAPEIYDMNASLYAYSPNFLESGKGIFEGKCDVIQMMDTAVLDLDHEIDFEFMQVIGDYLFTNYPLFGEVRNHIAQLIIPNN